MSQTPLHDWMRPRLEQVLQDAVAAGFERLAALAVLTDLATAPEFDTAPPTAEPAQVPPGTGMDQTPDRLP
jgi:hypothetical protein